MRKNEFRFRSSNGEVDVRSMEYIPDDRIIGILQIAHGMVEFIDRYEDFAKYLNSKGILVVGNDHIGHGGSVNSEDDWGYFGENGNRHVLDDMHELTILTKKKYPGLPYFLLGHSMGSFYARQYLCEYGNELDGAIIMGTGYEALSTVKAGMFLCRLIAAFKGWRYRSTFVNNIAFGSYGRKFEPLRTRADWLSKDEALVDWYVNEPRCSFLFTLNGYYSMFEGISRLHDRSLLEKVPKDLPIFFVSGKDDPVGSFGKEVEASVKSLEDVGVKNIQLKLYENDRHEILNETDKEIVYVDLYNWLKEHIGEGE
ncbi:MAG: alpha/beta fold hydrolase [Erysipelotrichaceae bacterium]|nr:alpha/beta fold hydrolase [Erysipelotrichaceae bacterium]MBR6232672.1 alpha/beta fold hydrolase [Erysipelotrichaceae bacterium]